MDATAWEVKETEFVDEAPLPVKMKFLIRYAILAPSSHNTQPWKFVIDDEQIRVIADVSRALPVADTDNRELYISIGCAIENLVITAKHVGYAPDIKYFPAGFETECVAAVRLSKSGRAEENELFYSINKRHTNRRIYEDKPIRQEYLDKLKNCTVDGIRVDFITGNETRKEIADIVEKGEVQFNNPYYRRELGFWIGQGAFGQKGIMAKIAKFFVSRFNSGDKVAEKDRKLILSSPVFGVISSVEDNKLSWVKTGEVYQRIALAATGMSIMLHPMNQGLIEVPVHRERLKEILGINETPQFAFRLGYAEPEKHQVRRQIEEVLVMEAKRRL